jgi:hypothetical protein
MTEGHITSDLAKRRVDLLKIHLLGVRVGVMSMFDRVYTVKMLYLG